MVEKERAQDRVEVEASTSLIFDSSNCGGWHRSDLEARKLTEAERGREDLRRLAIFMI